MASNGECRIKSEGINNQGNRYRAFDCGPDAPNQNAYQYLNADNSWYSSNPDGSQYFDDGRGNERLTTPDGDKYKARDGGPWVHVPEQK